MDLPFINHNSLYINIKNKWNIRGNISYVRQSLLAEVLCNSSPTPNLQVGYTEHFLQVLPVFTYLRFTWENSRYCSRHSQALPSGPFAI